MDAITSGTDGCDTGTSGVRRKLAWAMLAIFLLMLALITVGNAESQLAEFQAARVRETPAHVWTWQVTSIIGWLCVCPAIWWAVRRVRPPRFGWPLVAALFVAGVFAASAIHIGVMIALRMIVYAVAEHSRYHFQGDLPNPYLYEFRKDVATYLQFVLLAALCQWLLTRVGTPASPFAAPAPVRYLTVNDGTVTHQLPIAEIAQVAAAGNYVEIESGGRTLLHRATLAAIEAELGPGFVRVHRSRLVNRDAIRRIETNQSGDFDIVLADGARAKGSRRYRAAIEQRL
jgi:DNA-binding LytR/AlgR family response regulator